MSFFFPFARITIRAVTYHKKSLSGFKYTWGHLHSYVVKLSSTMLYSVQKLDVFRNTKDILWIKIQQTEKLCN